MIDTILVLMAPGFEEVEFCTPVDILRRLNIPVVTASVGEREVKSARGISMRADILLHDVDESEVGGIILPGGAGSWVLRDTPEALRLVRMVHEKGGLVAAICAAPIALRAAGVLNGKRVTAYPADEVIAAVSEVATVTHAPVERDGHIITGRGPGAAFEFGFAIASYLGFGKQVETLRKEMVYES